MELNKTECYVNEHKKEVIDTLKNFCQTDVILFWSENKELQKLQYEKWKPILDWLKKDFNINFMNTFNIFLPQENEDSANNFSLVLKKLSIKELCGCYCCALLLKSPILSFAAIKNKISLSEALEISLLEEIFQNKYWGTDKEVLKKRQQIKSDLSQIKEYLNK